MVWLLLVSAMILPGCGRGPCQCATTPAAKPAPASFAGVRGWGPLAWEMTLPQATAALDEARIYYTIPADPYAGRRESEADQRLYGEVAQRDEASPQPYRRPLPNQQILLELAGGWTGTITFGPAPKGQIVAIVLQSGVISSAEAVEALLNERNGKYGPATAIAQPNGTTRQLTWQNEATSLLVSVWGDPSTKQWRAVEQWSRLR